jgi:hypothetical protein
LDPRFASLLKTSFHQHQFFWRDYGHFTPLPDVAQEFIGVPGDVLLDENRYITADGCVPHDCQDRGMVWIDTASPETPTVLFAATGMVRGSLSDNGLGWHLWIFSSTKLDWQHMPAHFVASLTGWWEHPQEGAEREDLLLVTVVQPSGEMVDLLPSVLLLNQAH